MRTETKVRYDVALSELRPQSIPKKQFNEISKKHFNGALAILHILMRTGCMTEVGANVWQLRSDLTNEMMLNRIADSQSKSQQKSKEKIDHIRQLSAQPPRPDELKFPAHPSANGISKDVKSFTDKNGALSEDEVSVLVQKIRESGYEVTCKKTISF